jgi:branched-chain amino acid aminotransferase
MIYTEAISIKIDKIQNSRINELDFENIQFGNLFSDHMLLVEYKDGKWSTPHIKPFGEINLLPSISALHYGQAIFEGMKAFKSKNGDAQLFRPRDNWKRFNKSAKRLAMPEVPEDIFMNGLIKLIRMDAEWIPKKPGSSLYIRPVMFATDEFVGVRPSQKFLFMIFTCPVNAYYTKPLHVVIEQKYVRAFKGGVGYAKAAGNYAISMLPTKIANEQGYDQIIWTDGNEHQFIEESGTMNVFFHMGNTIYTPAVSDTILDGITRDSCIQILKKQGYEVVEGPISVSQIIEAYQNGKLKDVFGTGTAALIAKIASITYNGEKMVVSAGEETKVSDMLYGMLEDIRTSRVNDQFGWIEKI